MIYEIYKEDKIMNKESIAFYIIKMKYAFKGLLQIA